jgi:hypothetical protein
MSQDKDRTRKPEKEKVTPSPGILVNVRHPQTPNKTKPFQSNESIICLFPSLTGFCSENDLIQVDVSTERW